MQKLIESVAALSAKERKALAILLKQKGINLFGVAPIFKRDADEPLLLSYAQQRQWFLWQLDPDSAAYNLSKALRLIGALDLDALHNSLATLVACHESLRTTFIQDRDQVLQHIGDPVARPLLAEAHEAQWLASGEPGLRALVEAETGASFDLARGPLMRARLLRLAPHQHVLVLTLHHSICDGASLQVMADELVQLYADFSQGRQGSLPPLPVQYADYALWQRHWMEAGERERQLGYWQTQLAGEQPVLELPTDHARPAVQSFAGASVRVELGGRRLEALKRLTQQENVTGFMVLLASFQLLLHRYSGQSDIRVGVPIANRSRSETERLIGFLVNTQVLRAEVDSHATVRHLLQQVRKSALDAQAHQDLPFEQLVDVLQPERSLSRNPLFQVMFNHKAQDPQAASVQLPGLRIEGLEWESPTAQFDLSLNTVEHNGALSAAFIYATDLFDASTVERMAAHWLALLDAMLAAPQQRVDALPMLAASERKVLVEGWNTTATEYPLQQTVQQLIETQVEKTPNAQALAFGEERLSYRQLNERANQLAHYLIEQGVGPDVLVGVAAERSTEMVLALVAILKAGGAYVPLDPDYPQDRLSYMFEDSGVNLLLTQSALLQRLPLTDAMHTVALDQPGDWLAGYSTANPSVSVTGENLAYVIYTSGSTGKPKGAGNRHVALTNRLCWMQQAYGLDASDTVVQKTPFSFDVSVWELFWPLMTGARLVVAAPGDHRDPTKLVELIKREQISTLHFVPSMLQAFLQDESVRSCTSLKRIVCSGEALAVDIQQQVFAKLPNAGLYNLYGPTEAAIDVTYWTCIDEGRDSVPIGQPIANLTTYILDSSLEPLPVGVVGELYLGGIGLARGYHRRPSLTAERFIASPFVAGERLYRSGDLARYRADGVIEYAGRIDHQVKIRGLRIELGEIEARLLEHEAVREAVVLAHDGKRLVGYVVPTQADLLHASDDDQQALRTSLQLHLGLVMPEYMVPAHLLLLEQMPLSPNGKLDRKALPAPDASLQQAAYVAPGTELEQRIATIWQDVLKREQVGITDNFFALGGDSIVSIQVVSRARQAGIILTPKDLFQYQTVQSLARVAQLGSTLHINQAPVTGATPLLPFQQQFFETEIPERQQWNQSLLLKSSQAIDPLRLEQALQALVVHHDALRLNFTPDGQASHARVEQTQPLLWQAEAADEGQLHARCDEAQRSLSLQQGPLLRALLVQMADGSQRLLLAIHHLVVDGVSWRILLEDLQSAYQQLGSASRVKLAPKSSAFKAWAERLEQYAGSDAVQAQLGYWQQTLGNDLIDLPCDNPQGGLQNRHAATVQTRLDPILTRQLLQDAPEAYRTQVNDLLLTALARVICRWAGGASSVIQLEGHGREDLFEQIDLSRTVGWFTSLFPVRLTPAADLEQSLKTIKEQLRGVPEKGLGYGLLRYLGGSDERAAVAQLPIPRITFNYLGQFDGQFDEASLFVPASESSGAEQSIDAPLGNWLTVNGQVYGGELSLEWVYSREMFKDVTVQQLADAYAQELTALISHCSDPAHRGVTPSDFPLAGLSQAQLEVLPFALRDVEDIYPLSPMQQGMLFHSLYEQEGVDYINQLRVDVDGLDSERFQAAWQDTLAAHESLRSAFLWQGVFEQPVQVIARQVELPFVAFDWRGRDDLALALDGAAEEQHKRAFVLDRAPLLRLCLIQTGDARHHLIFTNHHILLDGWSNAQLFGEVLQRYAGQEVAQSAGRYRDYIAWLKGRDSAASESFWTEQLAALDAPTRLAQSLASGDAGAKGHGELVHVLDAAATQRLNTFAREQKVTLNTLVQSAWLLLLQRYTGQSTVAFGATVSGRPSALQGIEQQIGLFINTLPVIAGSEAQQTVGQWLQAVQALNLSLREQEHTPLFDIQRWAGQGGEALFDSILVFENYPLSDALQQAQTSGPRFGEVLTLEQTSYPLTLGINLDETLTLHYGYALQSFSAPVIARINAQLLHLLEQFRQSAQRPTGALDLLTASEWDHLRASNTPQPYTLQPFVHQRIAAQAPDSVALIVDGQTLSYGQLDSRANRLAHALMAEGVGPEVRVAVAMPRSENLMVALLAVLKAGGAYVPLDATYPQERLAYLMQDSGVALLLTASSLIGQLPNVAGLQALELDLMDFNHWPATAPVVDLHPDNLAYVIYTSGSTGQPKGVSVAHGPLSMHCQAIGERYAMTPADCELHFMSFAFDGAHERWLTSLTHGGSLLLRDDSLWTPEQTYAAMHQYGVTVAAFPPVYLQQLAEHAERDGNPPPVRIYCFGGDAVPQASFELAKRALRPQHIINGYGPTETVVTPLIWKAGPELQCGAAYAPIGSRIGDRSTYVLDDQLNPLSQGLCGELYLGGEGLARGYLNRPAMTAERFVPDPFGAPGGRFYRSGDLVRQRADGTTDYIGRIDHQVKIRGFRVELGEIEARLQDNPAVREAVVVAQPGLSGQQLVAYVVPSDLALLQDDRQPAAIKAQLKRVLPGYMVPAHLLLLSALPLTPNGKLDRKALPKPEAGASQVDYQAPQSELEQRIAVIWQEVLRLDQVGLNDNFFELGGDSIISIQVVSRARVAGIHFTPKDLFQHQTVQSLALVARTDSQRVQIDQGPVSGETPLLPVQQVFFELAIPERSHWNQSVLLKPVTALDAGRLEQALQALVSHHDALRMAFSEDATARYLTPAQLHATALLWQVPVADAQALETLSEQAQRSLDLASGVVIRAVLATLGDGSQRLLVAIHHLVVDGVSWRILLEDLQSAYRQLDAGQPLQLPAKTSAFKTWAERLHDHARSPALQDELRFWQAHLAGAVAHLPCDHPKGGLQSRHVLTVHTRLDSNQTRQLLQVAPAAYRTQVNDLLLTALARVICRWTGQASTLIQMEGHGREELFDEIDLTRTVGWFTSLFPVNLAPAAGLGDSVKAIKEQLRSIPQKGIGFGALRYLGNEDAQQVLRGLPTPRITFNYLGQFDGSFDEVDGALFVPSAENAGAEHSLDAPLGNWLTLNGQVYAGELSLDWRFSAQMFDTASIQRLADDLQQELAALIEHCTQALGVTPSDFPLARLSQAQLDALPMAVANIEDVYPLSPMQQGMLFHTLYEQDSADYINQMRLDVGGLDPQRLRQAWQAALDAHDSLRSGFVWQGELAQPVQVVFKHVELPYALHDWQDRKDLPAALDQLADQQRQQGFELAQAPLLNLQLVRIGDTRHHLIFTSHHLLMDGWSSSQLLGEVLQRYSGQAPANQPGRYRDYIGWLQAQDSGVSQQFWREQLAPLSEPTRLAEALAHDKHATVSASGYADHFLTLDRQQTQHLGDFARANKVTLNTLVQAAWLLLLQRHIGQSAVAFGATVSGRPAQLKGVEQQIGLFINTLPVIASPMPEQSVAQWLQVVQAQNLALREHEHTPLFDIQRWAGQGGAALFDNILVFENYPVSEALQQGEPDELNFGAVHSHERTNYPLTLMVNVGEQLAFQFSYIEAKFNGAAIVELAACLETLLARLAESAERALGEIDLLPVAQRQAVVTSWNNTATEYPLQQTVQQLIETQVEKTPDVQALAFGEECLSYRQLNERANQLAHYLIEQGVGPDVLVGVAAERSTEMVLALVAILKAGGAYVPLDPDYPQDRLSYMFEDSGVNLLLTQTALLQRLPLTDAMHTVALDQPGDWLAGYSTVNPSVSVTGENLAYVIYTSGSTGKPKGAGNRQVALTNRLCWMQQAYGLDASDSVVQKTPFSFDVSVWEFFWPLMTGARLVVAAPGDHRDPAKLVELINREQISTLHFVPSMLQAFLQDESVHSCTSLKRIVCSGEALAVDIQQQVFAKLPNAGLYNLYGPTEAAIDVTYWTCTDEGRDSVPIGQPIANLATYILDSSLEPLPVGVVGELYLGGIGLARGYHRRPSLTAERFIASPFVAGERLYRTGDLARYRADGVIEYGGRIDHQVKIRGLRIELGEIEARLLEHEAVREAVVLAQDGPAGKRLVGYVVPVDADLCQTDYLALLKTYLLQELPEYMVPASILLLEQMPLSPNGKLARNLLPLPEAVQAQSYVAPVNDVEATLVAIWQTVLGLAQVGVTDNFFALGGDSIVSIQVVSRARQAGIRFTPKDLFQHPTVQGLATVAKTGVSALVIDQSPVTGETLLLAMQQTFFEQAIPEQHHWNQSVLLTPRQALDGSALEQALNAVCAHHDALRLRFTEQASGWTARFGEVQAQAQRVWQVSLEHAEDLAVYGLEAQRSLNLQDGQLLRALLATLADGSQRLLLIIHHLVVDGVSWRILLEDLQVAYQQAQTGQPVRLPAKSSAIKHWAEHLQAYARSEVVQQELPFWQAQLQAGSELPCDHSDASLENRHAVTIQTQLDATLTRQLLQQAPAAYRTQVNDLLLTALARVISRWTGQSASSIALEGHGREDLFEDLDLTRTVGWFTSLFPVRLHTQDDLGASIKAIKEQLRAIPHKGIGFGALRYLGDEASKAALSALAMPRITFNYLGQFDSQFDDAALFVPASESAGAEQSAAANLANWLTLNSQVYGGELSLSWTFSQKMFDSQTIQALADDYAQELSALIAHCCDGVHGAVTPSDFPLAGLSQEQLDSLPLPASAVADIYPLSPMQHGMLFHSLYEQASGAYINQLRVDVDGLQVETFRAAWQAALDEHDILRSGFLWQGSFERPVQVVHKHVSVPLSVLDWQSRTDLDQALDALALGEREQPFDLQQPGLLRLTLVRTGEDRYHLIYSNHHILLDGWSNAQLFGEVLQRYTGEAVAPFAGRYHDYIAWLQRQDRAVSEAFWKQQLAQLNEPTRLAHSVSHGVESLGSGHAEQVRVLDRSFTQQLGEFARQQKVTLNTLVQGAWLLLLQRYTGQDAVAFGATVSGRPAELPGVEQQIGLFINTLPVVASPRPEQRLGEWLEQLQAQNFALREQEHTPLFDIQRWAGQGGEALFDNILVFENYPVSEALEQGATGGLRFGTVANHEQTNYPLTVLVNMGERLSLHFSFDLGSFSEGAIEQIATGMIHLLGCLEADTLLGDIDLLPVAERQRLIEGWNTTTTTEYPLQQTVQQLIETQVEKTPDAPALAFGEERLSYRQLNDRANQLAHYLIEQGVGRDVLVGVAAERSTEMVLALVAILKAGGAYVPLDPDYPQDRLSYMFEDSGVNLLLTQTALLQRLPLTDAMHTVALDQPGDWLAGYSTTNPSVGVTGENLAYVIYTSGSTGKPKGAGNRHVALTNRLCWMQQAYGLAASDTVVQKTPFSFDVSVWEFFWPLMTGARLVVAAPGDHRDPAKLVALINREQISTLHFVPSMLQAFLQDESVHSCTSLKRIVCSGEALAVDIQQQVFAKLPNAGLYNLYGPTEAAIDVTYWTCTDEGRDSVPIGQPIANLATYILDSSLEPLPVGVVGELYLGGIGLARGYHRRPSLTAERFIACPFVAGERLYRTGDLARYRADGVIEYAGRIDHQVKIRGLRIELGEIEARLLEHEAVREAVVLARDGKQLVGYVVLEPSVDADWRHILTEHLHACLPDYMVPSQWVALEHLPLSANGKLDRKALPAPDQVQEAYVAPSTAAEQALVAIWQGVLGREQVGVTDNFFALGGDSIVSIQVVSRAREAGLGLSPKDLFQHPNIRALALRVVNLDGAEPEPEHVADQVLHSLSPEQVQALPIPMAQVQSLYPLSPMQQGMLFLGLNAPDAELYVNQLSLPVKGLQVERFKRAWEVAFARHPILRTGFVWQDLEQPLQFVMDHLEVPLRELDWRDEVEPERRVQALAASERVQGFDLNQPPLQRIILVRLDDQRHQLIWTYHHILIDGWSISQLIGEVLAEYSGQALAPALPYENYISWLQRQDAQAGEQFWRQQLAVLDQPTYLADTVAAVRQGKGHKALYSRFDSATTEGFKGFAQSQKVTLNTLVQAAWLLLLSRYSGQRSVAFGATVSGRAASLPGSERILGLFINTLPVIQEITPHHCVGDWLRQLQAYNLDMREREYTPLADIQRWAGKAGQALFDSIIVFENQPIDQALRQWQDDSLAFGDSASAGLTDFPMDLMVTLEDGLVIEYMYLQEHFSDAVVEGIRANMEGLIQRLASDAGQRLGAIGLPATPSAVQAAAAVRESGWVHEQISQLAAAQGDAPAVLFAERRLSFAALHTRANRLARALIAEGVGPDVRVGVALPRSETMIVALLAVLKAGGAYVPLDASYPRERLAYMMQDSGIALLLTDSLLRGQLPIPANVHVLELDQLTLDGLPDTAPAVTVHGENLAYVIYTSGSTGQPKGVAVSHGPLAMHCQAIGERYEMSPNDCELHFMSFAFDGAHERWLTTLTHGGRLLIRDDSLWTPEQTYAAMHEHGVTVAAFPPVYLQQLAEQAERDGNPPPVRIYCFGGDAVPQASFDLAQRALRPRFIINGYGPTETVVTPLIWKAGPQDVCGAAYAPIGSRIGNRSAHVLDMDLNLLPSGLAGELYLGGEGLARGYLNRPAMTAERFVPDPYSLDGARLYRSGDLVRQRADGTTDYLGRIDQQVKIRGFRIELGEVEACLKDSAEVREAVVIARDAGSGKQLLGYVIAADSAVDQGLVQRLREQLQQTLPDYMVPTHLIRLEQLPLTPNGKLDRKALPEPSANLATGGYVAPVTEVQKALAQLWQTLLKVERVGLDDNFFELGGDSILSLQLVARSRVLKNQGFSLKLRDLMQKPTIGELTADASAAVQRSPLLVLSPAVAGRSPLFCVHAGFGTVFDYEPLARALSGQRQVIAIQSRMLLDPLWQDASLHSMARDYVAYLRQQQAEGPYHLIGWSLGGTLASLMSAELQRQGQTVELLGLLDAYVPGEPSVPVDDWQADLREFIEVTRFDLSRHLKLSGAETAQNLRQLLADALAREGSDATRPGFGADELAQVFTVARHLKQRSLQLAACEPLKVRPQCWWTAGRGEEAIRLAGQLEQPTAGYLLDCGHFEVPRSEQLLAWLVDVLAEPVAVL
ncbi:amino acid adenylation domain-containing protein [Pseudomonas sp. ANT_H14]|uniref:non-ribosomal peptide synthase/polyketide synthase n=2 Tax=Gammaproteobacteria TaxID=1236 RepID=UPI0011EDCF5C|nr:amino acid adenylation domain-containing protein [Pseudomonas sp. ANT_H4]KAA0951117.1 amino acid adenylation domain-containing protein [Pseudomonas sp. ANT_H14]